MVRRGSEGVLGATRAQVGCYGWSRNGESTAVLLWTNELRVISPAAIEKTIDKKVTSAYKIKKSKLTIRATMGFLSAGRHGSL
jgi:hypothetical protein